MGGSCFESLAYAIGFASFSVFTNRIAIKKGFYRGSPSSQTTSFLIFEVFCLFSLYFLFFLPFAKVCYGTAKSWFSDPRNAFALTQLASALLCFFFFVCYPSRSIEKLLVLFGSKTDLPKRMHLLAI